MVIEITDKLKKKENHNFKKGCAFCKYDMTDGISAVILAL